MSIYCNCRHCVATPTREMPEPEPKDIELQCLVNEYVALDDKEFQLHWRAMMEAESQRNSLYSEDDDDEE